MEGGSTNVYPYRGYCCRVYTEPEGNLCRVPDLLQNLQKCRVLWCNCHRTHRSVGYCGATATELTKVSGIVVLRSQNSQGNLCRVTTDRNYPRYPRESLYLYTFVRWIRLGCIIYKTKIKDRSKRARVRTDPTTHHIPILNFPGETRKTVGLVNPAPAKNKSEKKMQRFPAFACPSTILPSPLPRGKKPKRRK